MAGRIETQDGPLDFTCRNNRFETNTQRGHPHGRYPARGSVFTEPLLAAEEESGGYSLWLEYVRDHKENDDDYFWLMWYGGDGRPTIPLSGVFRRNDIGEIGRRLASFIPEL